MLGFARLRPLHACTRMTESPAAIREAHSAPHQAVLALTDRDDGDENTRFLRAMAEIAAIEDHCERAAVGARVFGKRWVDVMMMWHTEGGKFAAKDD